MTDHQHRVEVRQGLPSSPHNPAEFGAHCSCGWEGQSQRTEVDAEQDGDDHVVAVT